MRESKLKGISGKMIIMVMIASILIFLFVFVLCLYLWRVEGSGELGTLITGTIGVGVNICAMIALIATLWEQQKANKQAEIHHLIGDFKDTVNSFLALIDNPEIEKSLDDLWNRENDNSIQSCLDKIGYRLRGSTYETMRELKGFCDNECLKKISYSLNHILLVKEEIDRQDYMSRRIHDDWNSISRKWKIYAGFYFAWCTQDITRSVQDAIKNEMIKLFFEEAEDKIPESIPKVIISNKEDIKQLDHNWFEQFITIESKSPYDIEIRATVVSWNGNDLLRSDTSIVLKSSTSTTCKLSQLFKNETDKLLNMIKDLNTQSIADLDIHMLYQEKKWTYEGKLEFHFYPNNHVSVIFKEISD